MTILSLLLVAVMVCTSSANEEITTLELVADVKFMYEFSNWYIDLENADLSGDVDFYVDVQAGDKLLMMWKTSTEVADYDPQLHWQSCSDSIAGEPPVCGFLTGNGYGGNIADTDNDGNTEYVGLQVFDVSADAVDDDSLTVTFAVGDYTLTFEITVITASNESIGSTYSDLLKRLSWAEMFVRVDLPADG